MDNIYIIGYFGHKNTGDEQYLITFDYMLKTFLPNFEMYNIIYIDCDKTSDTKFIDSDIIILGGGDVLNNYFLDQIISKFINKPNKILAVSVGIPYTDILVNTNKLNIIDYIFVRTEQDNHILQKHFHPNRIFYIPDLSTFLPCQEQPSPTSLEREISKIKNSGKKIIAITLSRHIYNNNPNYNDILIDISKFVKYLLTFDYHVVLLPFNTNEKNTLENDILIHNDLMKYFGSRQALSITNINITLNPSQVLSLYKYFYATIPMRFHATLFSIYTNTPMLPLFTTRKIKNLLLDIVWNIGYQLECNELDLPLHVNDIILINRFRTLVACHDNLTNKLLQINQNNFSEINFKRLSQLISCDYSKINFSLDTNIIKTKAQDIFDKIQTLANKNGYKDFRLITEPLLQKLITQTCSYYLTNGIIDSIYNYGLSCKMFNENFNYISEWSWVIKDHNKKQLSSKINNPHGLFNINYIDQIDYSGAHRSGWQYVYENIKYLHNENSSLYLDLYLDRTFHWNKEVNKQVNLIPYTFNWIGFIHHTFDTSFSDYNNHNLFANPDFITSLKYCKGIFVLSKTLKLQLVHEFNKRNLYIPVYNLIHPTEIHVPQFTFQKFIKNTDKKLVHIGGWLRNIFSFYNLVIPTTSFNPIDINFTFCEKLKKNTIKQGQGLKIRKVALKGHSMNNYYPSSDFTTQLQTFLTSIENPTQNSCQNCCQNISQNVSQNVSQNCSTNIKELYNNWYKHFYSHTKFICDSVDFIEKLSNNDYDTLLTENIVFINLVDASAVNTIIECIIRNTPIIINNHPAVVEILGEHYPLYFTSNNYFEMNKQIYEMLLDTNNIKKAHLYLKNLNKSNFNINNFKHKFIDCIAHIKLSL